MREDPGWQGPSLQSQHCPADLPSLKHTGQLGALIGGTVQARMPCFVVNNALFLAIQPAYRSTGLFLYLSSGAYSVPTLHNVELTRNVQTFIPAVVPQVSTSSDLLPVLEISKEAKQASKHP